MPFAALAIHHPRPEHRDEWIEVMRQIRSGAAPPGLIHRTGYADTKGGRLVGLSRWEFREALDAVIGAAIAGAAALDAIWADQPTDVLVLEELE